MKWSDAQKVAWAAFAVAYACYGVCVAVGLLTHWDGQAGGALFPIVLLMWAALLAGLGIAVWEMRKRWRTSLLLVLIPLSILASLAWLA